MDLISVFNFLESVSNSVLSFSTSVIDFMSYSILDTNVFSILFGASVTVFLGYILVKWLI